MKLALILNVIDPKIGGVMIMGDRGTGKSTTIRAVADLLPAIQVAANDPFNSSTTDFELMSEEVKQAVENNKEIEYEKKNIAEGYKIQDLLELVPNARTMPQIWLDEEHVGGFFELEKRLK